MVYLSISDIIDRSWTLVKKYGLVLVIVYFVLSFLQSAIGQLFAPPIDSGALMTAIQQNDIDTITSIYLSNPTGTIIEGILGIVLFLGLFNSMLLLAKGIDNEVSFNHWKQDVSVYINYGVTYILVNIIVCLGYACCILPGLFFSARLSFAKLRALDCPKEGVLEHISASWELTKGNSMTLIGLMIVQFFIIVIGLILCCIGVLPAIVLVIFSEIVAYLMLTRYYEKSQEETITAE